MDRWYAVSNLFRSDARAVASRAREIELELGIGQLWCSLFMGFSRNLPRVCDFAILPLSPTSTFIVDWD
ncbi:hypothetical protein KSP39_PZI001242 [Platanthera zijinensis]|uniref:Uncharacterized protein n=1 Tax=Platanthera zijinensis TaxID=2320716 RepID=A0AAP0C511_9ASPA